MDDLLGGMISLFRVISFTEDRVIDALTDDSI
jgi:hypothetical protein